MKAIKIKCFGESAELRENAFWRALEFERDWLPIKKTGSRHGVVWVNHRTGATYYAYHTKTEIIVECSLKP